MTSTIPPAPVTNRDAMPKIRFSMVKITPRYHQSFQPLRNPAPTTICIIPRTATAPPDSPAISSISGSTAMPVAASMIPETRSSSPNST